MNSTLRGNSARARRRAEALRLAAIARQRALDEALRYRVQSMIERDDTVGEDPEIRRVAVNALGNHAGTVVVMDPKTGRIYSIVNQEWALHEGFKPCSTIKLVTGLAGLNEKVIDLADTDAGANFNRTSLTSALAHSKNQYFQTVGGRVGFEKLVSYARRLGLGEKTGINARNEFQGRLPAARSGFAVNHMSSHGDDFKVTAVQLATLVSAMANGGKLLAPFIAHVKPAVKDSPKVRRLVNIDPDIWQHMVPGMVGAVNYGSGRRAFDPVKTIAGKTGTCKEEGAWVGLFTSYAPLEDPKLAVVVIARGADGRNHFPAAVAGRIYRDLNGYFGATNTAVASRDSNAKAGSANSQISRNQESANEDDDETDSNDDNVTSVTATPVTRIANSSTMTWGNEPPTRVRRVMMPIPRQK